MALEKFGDNYAKALQYLLSKSELYEFEEMNAKIDILADEINKINNKLENMNRQPERVIKSASGKVVKLGGMMNNEQDKSIDRER